MSFVDEDDIFAALEHAIPSAWEACDFRRWTPHRAVPGMTWRQAWTAMGSTSPTPASSCVCCRDLTGIVAHVGFPVFAEAVAAGGVVKGICVRAATSEPERHRRPADQVARGASGRGSHTSGSALRLAGGHREVLHPEELDAIGAGTGAETGDCVLMVGRPSEVVNGGARRGFAISWPGAPSVTTDAAHRHAVGHRVPMFERSDETGEISAAHHPFTHDPCQTMWISRSDPSRSARAAYDLVVNGRENRQRQHPHQPPATQQRVLAALGIDAEERSVKSAVLLEAQPFEYGVQPAAVVRLKRCAVCGHGRDPLALPRQTIRRA